jgi:hypothetical protein
MEATVRHARGKQANFEKFESVGAIGYQVSSEGVKRRLWPD